jgi:hypothetical protein
MTAIIGIRSTLWHNHDEELQELLTVTFREDPRGHLNLVWCEHDLGAHASAEPITRVRERFHDTHVLDAALLLARV